MVVMRGLVKGIILAIVAAQESFFLRSPPQGSSGRGAK